MDAWQLRIVRDFTRDEGTVGAFEGYLICAGETVSNNVGLRTRQDVIDWGSTMKARILNAGGRHGEEVIDL